MVQNLFFNILTFDWPKQPLTFYFSKEKNGKCQKLHSTQFPTEITKIFPGIEKGGTTTLYTTFNREREGFLPLEIDFSKDNRDLLRKFYDDEINFYFRRIRNKIVRIGFINENQVWLKSKSDESADYTVYQKFSLKIQFEQVSKFPELVVTYDGISKVMKQSVAEMIKQVDPKAFGLVLNGQNLYKWKDCAEYDDIHPEECFPIINKDIEGALGMEVELPPRDNRYNKYLFLIQSFFKGFLNTDEFKEKIPLNCTSFIPVNQTRISRTSEESNILLFSGNQQDMVPKTALGRLKPFKKSPYPNIHLFFIFHKDDLEYAKQIKDQLQEGMAHFKGLGNYVGLHLYTSPKFSIQFTDKENPITEIEEQLALRQFEPGVKYMAVYLTPYSKFERSRPKREFYYQLKEILLQYKIASQAIDPQKMIQAGENWKFSLPNIAVAMLAKLDGIPWSLNIPERNELIVGIGAFKNMDEGVQYIGSAFSFSNNGRFNKFEYFLKNEINLLAGSIADAVVDYSAAKSEPDRIIIHFYKTMSDKELQPILNKLENLNLSVPVYIISINKTESEDLVAFDNDWRELMPLSGTFIRVGEHKYLLFNNTRYNGKTYSSADGFPFPLKLKIQCDKPELLNDTKEINELIEQVYQFSRMYYKSIRQQNLPVTIKYPEMVAQIAPHFLDPEIPEYGKSHLWFL